MRRWYQNVPVEGAVYESEERKDSKFWNEGKWTNFIAPLLPSERRTFLDIGCNAGLMLKLASDTGFQKVIGIDASLTALRQARLYRTSVGGSWTLIPQVIGVNLALDALPLADVTLLANVHYHIRIGAFAKLVDQLLHRTLYCLVVSAKARRYGDRAGWSRRAIRGYFRDWAEMATVESVEEAGDPAPRVGMYSVLFRGPLRSQAVEPIYNELWDGHARSSEFNFNALMPALKQFIEMVLSGEDFGYEDTQLYKYWQVRDPKGNALKRLTQKHALIEDMQVNGMREPVYYDHRGHFVDGLTRLCIARALGYKHVITRRL